MTALAGDGTDVELSVSVDGAPASPSLGGPHSFSIMIHQVEAILLLKRGWAFVLRYFRLNLETGFMKTSCRIKSFPGLSLRTG